MKARARRVRPLFRRTPCLMAALLACAWPAQRGRARDPGGRADAPAQANTRNVVLDVASPERFDAESEATLRELLARLGLRLVRSEPPAQATIIAYVRVQSAGRGALVIVSDGRGHVAPVRREVPPAATRTLFRETLAHVILGAVEPLAATEPATPSGAARSPTAGSPGGAPASSTKGAAGSAAGSSTTATGPAAGTSATGTGSAGAASSARSAAAEDATSPSPAGAPTRAAPASSAPPHAETAVNPSAAKAEQRPEASSADATPSAQIERAQGLAWPRTWALSLGARGTGVVLASERMSARFGGAAALVFPARLAPALALDASYTLPIHIDRGGVEADFSLVSVRGSARVEPYRRARWALRAALGGGVDIISMQPTKSMPGLRPARSTRRPHPMLGAALGARFAMLAKLALVFELGLDVDCGPAVWTVPMADEDRRAARFFEPARVRPYASLGVDWSWLQARTRARAERP